MKFDINNNDMNYNDMNHNDMNHNDMNHLESIHGNLIAENQTTHDYDTYKKLNEVVFEKTMVFTLIVSLILLLCGGGILLLKGFDFLGFIYTALGIVLPLSILLISKYKIRKSIDECLRFNGNLISVYSFYTDILVIKTKSPFGEGIRTITYDNIKNIVETNDYLFLFITRNKAFCVNKNNFEANSGINVLDYLKSICKKYKTINK